MTDAGRVREQLLLRLLDQSLDGLVALNEHGTIVDANDAAGRLFGRRRTFLVGKPLASLLPVGDRRALRSAFGHALAGEPAELSVTLPPQDAKLTISLRGVARVTPPHVTARLTLADRVPPPEAQPEGQLEIDRILRRFPHGVVGVAPDLTIAFMNPSARRLLGLRAADVGRPFPGGELRILVERLLRNRAAPAPDIVVHRECELRVTGVPGRAGDPALLLLEDVTGERQRDRVTAEFLRNASHQLRTPLTAIGAAIDALRAGAEDDPEERERFIAHIEQHVARMTRLTRGLLVLSRAQSGERRMQFDAVELQPLVERLAAHARPDDGVAIEVSCAPGVAAFGDADLIEETIAALVDNAVAHTRLGRIGVRTDRSGWTAEIEVTDSGPGILPEHRERVFQPFYSPLQGRGFGLGLAIARQAVETMGGEIEIGGGVGEGTRVLVRLPSARVVAAR